jgi:hypothetical protein
MGPTAGLVASSLVEMGIKILETPIRIIRGVNSGIVLPAIWEPYPRIAATSAAVWEGPEVQRPAHRGPAGVHVIMESVTR